MADEFCLKMPDFHVTFKDLLYAVNLRHGTDGFTSPPKEGVLRIFSSWKIQRLRSGLNPRTWVPKASTLPLDHRSRHERASVSRYTEIACLIYFSKNECAAFPLHIIKLLLLAAVSQSSLRSVLKCKLYLTSFLFVRAKYLSTRLCWISRPSL